ncbi:MAG TPA: hypothetical protein VFR21_32040 [Bradyrhizobium sp.]|jgi:hypothetical protein|nr:hypothetical protein [Bradyrhizobium sp.]
MRFILVNGRTPCRQSSCALCSKPIGTSYLREIATRLPYCDAYCYSDHCVGAILALEARDGDLHRARHIEELSAISFPSGHGIG